MSEKKKVFTKDTLFDLFMNNKSVLLLVIMVLFAQVASGGLFFKPSNISTIFRQCAVPCIMTMGYVFVLTSGGIDLSVGHMVSMCCVAYNQIAIKGTDGTLTATVVNNKVFIIAIIGTLIIGAAAGFVNAFLINKFNLTPFILTMGTGQIYRSIAYVLCGGQSYTVRIESMKYIGQGMVFGWLPVSVILFAILTVFTAIIIYRTKFGRHIVATGGNIEAARVSGINTALTKICATCIMGVMMAIAAIVLTGRVAVAQPAGGSGMEMDAIAGVVIGGTSLGGGKPNVIGAIFGALILSVISNTLNLTGVDAFLQWAFKGGIIIIAILLDTATEKILAKRQLNATK